MSICLGIGGDERFKIFQSIYASWSVFYSRLALGCAHLIYACPPLLSDDLRVFTLRDTKTNPSGSEYVRTIELNEKNQQLGHLQWWAVYVKPRNSLLACYCAVTSAYFYN